MQFKYSDLPPSKYTTWYIELMETRKFQAKKKFKTEDHHIFPVSIYGENDFTVALTHREHFIAHMLLWKMFPKGSLEFHKMVFAFNIMSDRQSIRGPLYEKIKIDTHKEITKHWQEYWGDEDNRKSQSNARKKNFEDPEKYAAMVKTNREITSRPEWRKQRSEKQKEFSADPEYSKLRIDAMSTPEAKAKSMASNRKRIDAMTSEERKKVFGRKLSKVERKTHSESIKGRRGIIHPATLQKKVIKPDQLQNFIIDGWLLQTEYTKNKDK